MASYRASRRGLEDEISDISLSIERMQRSLEDRTSVSRRKGNKTIRRRDDLVTPTPPRNMSQDTRGSVPGASGKYSRRRRVEDDLRAQWRVVCSKSSDSNDEGIKYHKSQSLLPVVSAGCEPRSVDAGATLGNRRRR